MKDLINEQKFKEYLDFITFAAREYSNDEYGEIHHIYPKCIDAEKIHINETVKISAQNHFKAHLMLVDCFEGESKKKLAYAVNMFRRGKHKDYLTLDQIQTARQVFSQSRKCKHTDKAKKKMSVSTKKQLQNPEYREKISKTLKEKWKNDSEFACRERKILKQPRSEQAKRNISEGSRRRSQKETYKKKMAAIYSSAEYRENISNSKKGKKLFTNGIEKHFYFLGSEPEGYLLCHM